MPFARPSRAPPAPRPIFRASQERFTGDVERAATTLLKDFRSGNLGRFCLEWPDAPVVAAAGGDVGGDDANGV